jgi:hypothetical protein
MFTAGRALDPALNAVGACNEGFLRADALLVLVSITDEEDDHEAACNLNPGSPGEPSDWFDTIVAAKAGVDPSCALIDSSAWQRFYQVSHALPASGPRAP